MNTSVPISTKYNTIHLRSQAKNSKMDEAPTITTGHDPIKSFCYDHCRYLPAMLGWFFFSAILSSYNKYVFGDEHMDFPCPLLMTSIHFLIQWVFAEAACACFPEALGSRRVSRMTWTEWTIISVPCGIVTALDIGLSNLSMVTLTLTFYTMVKSSSPIFVLAFAFLFKLEPITLRLIGVILIIVLGEFISVYGAVEFKLGGFLLCLSASMLSGLRWTLVQTMLQTLDPPLESTIVTMKILAPSMFWCLLGISMMIEKPWKKLNDFDNEIYQDNPVLFLGILGLIGGSLAVLMILCEFFLILRASAIILMIGGVIKELTTISVGVSVFGDSINMQKAVGAVIVFVGVVLYKVVFHMQNKEYQTTDMAAVPTEETLIEEDVFVDDDHSLEIDAGADVTNTSYSDSANDINEGEDIIEG